MQIKVSRFIDEYMIDLNGKQAAIRAGYSQKTAESQASRLLSNAKVRAELSDRMKARGIKTEITQERVLQEIARIALFDPRSLFNSDGSPKPINELDDDTAAAIAGLDVTEEYDGSGPERVFVGHTKKYKISDKNSALDKLAKHLDLYAPTKHEHGGNIGVTVNVAFD